MNRALSVSFSAELPIPVADAWELLSNTDHINRSTGLPPVFFGKPVVNTDVFYREATARAYGMKMQWREYPFQWVREQKYSVIREFTKGPLTRLQLGVELRSTPRGTLLRTYAEITPKWRFLRPLAMHIGRKGLKDLFKYCQHYLHLHQDPNRLKKASHYEQLPAAKEVAPTETGLLDRLISKLQKEIELDPRLTTLLREHIVHSSDEQVLRIKCFELADLWEASRDDVLRLFLHATKAGIFHLDWESICPHCRVPVAESKSLETVNDSAHCDLCGTTYELNMDQFIELRFSINPEIRQAKSEVYCIGGPLSAPHILAQQILQPDEERVFQIRLTEQSYRIRALKQNHAVSLEPRGSIDGVNIRYSTIGFGVDEFPFSPGDVEVKIKNRTQRSAVFVLEKILWDPAAVTAAYVTTLPEFRNLFSSEVLAPGRQIGIRNLCILFTDLKHSTSLYQQVGDAPAYGRVARHFAYLEEKILKNRGLLVKTIGDAVMAVFPSVPTALSAAFDIQNGVEEFNRSHQIHPPLVIKIGFHHGPAIVVNANKTLDYFGHTVNVAARIQNESLGGDIAMAAEIYNEAEVQSVLKRFPCTVKSYSVELKGVSKPLDLCRLTCKKSDPHHSTLQAV